MERVGEYVYKYDEYGQKDAITLGPYEMESGSVYIG